MPRKSKTAIKPKPSKENINIKVDPETTEDHRCGACGSQAFGVLFNYPRQTDSGIAPDGTYYEAIERDLIQCSACGQCGYLKRYV